MATQSDPPSRSNSVSVIVLNDAEGNYLQVSCGKLEGKLYVDWLKSGGGSKGAVKYIFAESTWLSPNEFESSGGKVKSKKWRSSIVHNSFPLHICLPSLGIPSGKSTSVPRGDNPSLSYQTPPSTSVNVSIPSQSVSCIVANPVLAFMKAHRLSGDSSSLKSTLLASFDASSNSLNDAVKCLWKFCRQDLLDIGLTYHTRRNSEKCDLSDALFTDVSTALDRLDLANKLPEIYCEANDLLSILSLNLEVDPVSKRIEANTLSIDRLMASFGELPKVISKQVVKDSASAQKALQDLINSAQSITDQSRSTYSSALQSQLPSKYSSAKSNTSKCTVSSSRMPRVIDRSSNIVLFGLPEGDSLADLKEAVDCFLQHISGRAVNFNDAYRIGRRNSTDVSGPISSPPPPRPILI